MVKPEVVTEDNMILLARDIAKKIEAELEYPGQIKVNVIRETKAMEFAKYTPTPGEETPRGNFSAPRRAAAVKRSLMN